MGHRMDDLRTDISSLWLAILVLGYFIWRTRRQMKQLIATLEEVIREQERRISEQRSEEQRRAKDS
jgi:C4-dicarboxylate-specific signal transduction histidine kinase